MRVQTTPLVVRWTAERFPVRGDSHPQRPAASPEAVLRDPRHRGGAARPPAPPTTPVRPPPGLRLLPQRSLVFREGAVAREGRRLRRSLRRARLCCAPTTALPVAGAIPVCPVVARGVMRTRAVPLPSMPSARAAPRDTSSARPPTKGPRSLILTTTDQPLARFVTRTRVPSGSEG